MIRIIIMMIMIRIMIIITTTTRKRKYSMGFVRSQCHLKTNAHGPVVKENNRSHVTDQQVNHLKN